jgi:uncharacterized protein YjdB
MASGALKLTGNGSLITVGAGAKVTLGSTGKVLALEGKSGNTAALVTVNGGELTLENGAVIKNNQNTDGDGGGVYVASGTFTMTGGEISGNESAGNGGGVYISGTGTFSKTGGVIYGDDDNNHGDPDNSAQGSMSGHAVYFAPSLGYYRDIDLDEADNISTGYLPVTAEQFYDGTNWIKKGLGITLNRSSLSLAMTETFMLVPTITPDNAPNKVVIWSSDKTSVATVSAAGLVTPKATGTAVITATTNDGAKTATCPVTVVIPVTNISGVPTVVAIDKFQGLSNYSIAPYNATYRNVVWSVKNAAGTGAVFNGNTLNVTNWGTVTVTATIANGKGLQDYTQDFDILFRDRIMITSLAIDNITITIGVHGGAPVGSHFHPTPADADTDICYDMNFTLDDPTLATLNSTMIDYWEAKKVGTTRVTAKFRQFPSIPVTPFYLTVTK